MFRKLRALLGVRSPSEWVLTGDGTAVRWADLGAAVAQGMATGVRQASERRAELLASGMTPEEAQAVMLREMFADPGFADVMAYAEGVARRSFWSLYEDEDKENIG